MNKRFKLVIIEKAYNHSLFDTEYKEYNSYDLQVCHILSNSVKTKKMIAKKLLCDNQIASLICDMPILNTLIGTGNDNAFYKKDIRYIDNRIKKIAIETIANSITSKQLKQLLTIDIFDKFFLLLNNEKSDIKDFQNLHDEFHKKIGLWN